MESHELLLSIVVKESDGFTASPHCGILIDRKVYGKVTKPPISGWELLPLFKIKLMDFATIMAMAVLVGTQPGHEILLFVRIEVTEKYAWDCIPCWLAVYGLPTISCVSHIV